MPATTSTTWTNTAGGLWGTGTNWSNGVPTSSTAVSITTAGSYTIDIAAATAAAAYSIALNDAGATLEDQGTLSLTAGLAITAGTFVLASGGELAGGTITTTSTGTFSAAGGTLSGVTYDGTLALNAANAALSLLGANTFDTSTGGTNGLIALTGTDAVLDQIGSATLNAVTLTLGNGTLATSASTFSVLDTGGAGILTLGPKAITNVTGGFAVLSDGGGAGDGIVNAGTITVNDVTKTTLTVSGNSFSNTGSMLVEGGAASITSASFTNSGIVTVTKATGSGTLSIAGATATNTTTITVSNGKFIEASTNFANLGTIAISGGTVEFGGTALSQVVTQTDSWSSTGGIALTGGTLELNGAFTTASLNEITASGTGKIDIFGSLNNTGQTLNVGAGSALGTITFGTDAVTYDVTSTGTVENIYGYGYITGGTIHDAGGGLKFNYGTLDGVTYQGTLAVTGSDTNVSIQDGITLQNLAGNGPGAMVIGGATQKYSTYVALYGSTVLNNATVTMGSNDTTSTSHGTVTVTAIGSYLYGVDTGSTGPQTITLGANLIVQESTTAHFVLISDGGDAGDALINAGSIIANGATGDMDLSGVNLTNSGDIVLTNGGTLEFDSYNQFINSGTITTTGGTLFIDTNATGPNPGGTYTAVATTFFNTGIITATGSDVEFAGTLATGWQNNLFATGGQTYLEQYTYAEDAGTTLIIGNGQTGIANRLVVGGTVIGGTIVDTGNGLVAAGGTLEGVTYQGVFDPTTETGPAGDTGYTYHDIDIQDGITLVGAGGSGPGTATLTNGVSLLGIGNNLVDNASITLSGVTLGEDPSYHGTFTLGANASVTQTGAAATLQSGTGATDLLDNLGTVTIAGTGTLTLAGTAFDNAGTFALGAGTLLDSATVVDNTGAITLAGGTLDANDVTSSGAITGFGLLETATPGGAIVNNGLITASGGAITIGSALSGTGTLAFGTGGSFVLDQPGAVTATLASPIAGDTLDLVGVTGATAAISGGAVVVSLAGGGTDSFTIAGSTAGETVGLLPDGQGGSDLVFANLAVASLSGSPVSFGNVHVGGTDTATLSVTNDAAISAFTEYLDASLSGATGAVSGSGSVTGLAAGATDATDLVITLNTAASGEAAGAITVSLTSDGTGIDGNAPVLIGTETVNASGAVYAYAAPDLASTSVNLGTVRVGGTLSGSVSLADGTTASQYQESLVYSASGAGSGAGTIASGGSALVGLSLAATTSGDISGTATLSLTSTGIGTDGLADTGLASQTVTVTGTVYQAAAAQFGTTTISFGNVHVGDSVTGTLGLTNTATGALVDNLLARISAISAGFSGSGSLSLGSGDSGSFAIGLNTSEAGSLTGSLAVNTATYDSALGRAFLGTQDIALSGAVYAYAAPTLGATTVDLGAVRVGGTASGVVSLADGTTASAYQESLIYSASGAASGQGTLLSGAATDLGLSLYAGTSGTLTGGAVLSLISTGAGTSGLADTNLGTQTVSVTAEAYQTAQAQLGATTLNFGIVHVGDASTDTLSVTNIASGALVDDLIATLNGSNGGFSADGSLSLAAGANGSIIIDLDTDAAGTYGGSLTLGLGSYDAALGELVLDGETITLSGTVDNYAVAGVSGTGEDDFTATGGSTAIDFGTTYFGSTASEALSISNAATGQADLLEGSISVLGSAAGFDNTGLGSFSGLTAGQAFNGIDITLTGTLSGTYSETLVLTATGYNSSGYAGALGTETLTVTDTVIGTYTLSAGETIAAGDGTDIITTTAAALVRGDNIDGGGGSNTLVLSGAGAFDLAAPKTLTNITTIDASEMTGAIQTVTLRDRGVSTVNVASVAGGSISIIASSMADTINLGNGADTIVVGGKANIINGGSGTDIYDVTAATLAAHITAGSGISDLNVSGGGVAKMGSSLVGSFTAVNLHGSLYNFTADTQAGLAINAGAGTDTITVGAASQTVTGAGANTTLTVNATNVQAGVLISNVSTASVLDITTSGTATLNAGDTGITVALEKLGTLQLGGLGFITAVADVTRDSIIAGGANQTLTSLAGSASLTGYTGFGDIFSGTTAGLTGDKIYNFGGSDIINISNLTSVTSETITVHAANTVIDLSGAGGSVSVELLGSYKAADFTIGHAANGGTSISFSAH